MRILLALAFTVVGCKARQDTATLQDNGAEAKAPAACKTGFEPTCSVDELGALLLGVANEIDAASTDVANKVGVVSYVAESETTGALLNDAETAINELRQRVVALRSEVSAAGPAAEASLTNLASLLEKAGAINTRLAQVRQQQNLPVDAPEQAQLQVVERSLLVLLERIRTMTSEATNAQSEDLVFWVSAYTKMSTMTGWLRAESGVSNVRAGSKHNVSFRVLKSRKAAVLRAYGGYINESYTKESFEAGEYGDWQTFKLEIKYSCHFATVWLYVSNKCDKLDRYGSARSEFVRERRTKGCYEYHPSDKMSVWLKAPMDNPRVSIYNDFPDHVKSCITDWNYPES